MGYDFQISKYLAMAFKDSIESELRTHGISRFDILFISKIEHKYRVIVKHKSYDNHNCTVYEFLTYLDWTLSQPYKVAVANLKGQEFSDCEILDPAFDSVKDFEYWLDFVKTSWATCTETEQQ